MGVRVRTLTRRVGLEARAPDCEALGSARGPSVRQGALRRFRLLLRGDLMKPPEWRPRVGKQPRRLGGQPDRALAVLLKRLRQERALTQEQLALEAGITMSSLSRIERGLTNPGWTTVGKIATALSVSLAELAAGSDEAD
jgi:DNA-binding XRE family transcriptional regulator